MPVSPVALLCYASSGACGLVSMFSLYTQLYFNSFSTKCPTGDVWWCHDRNICPAGKTNRFFQCRWSSPLCLIIICRGRTPGDELLHPPKCHFVPSRGVVSNRIGATPCNLRYSTKGKVQTQAVVLQRQCCQEILLPKAE